MKNGLLIYYQNFHVWSSAKLELLFVFYIIASRQSNLRHSHFGVSDAK